MKAQDLRVGNWVVRSYLPGPKKSAVQIGAVTGDFWKNEGSVAHKSEDGRGASSGVPLGEIEGIQLTPEILEVCGFEPYVSWVLKLPQLKPNISRTITLDIGADANGVLLLEGQVGKIDDAVYLIRGRAPYLHELQNLYYSLAGKELEIPGDKLRKALRK